MLWGFSKSDNPTTLPGGFCNYETDFGWGRTIADYPKLGTTEDFLLIGGNIYPTPATFLESDVGWIIKPVKSRKAITTCPSAGSIVSGKQTQLLNPNGTPNIPKVATAVPTAAYSPPAPAPQMNGIYSIDTLDGQLTHAVSAIDPNHGSSVALWTGHTIFGGRRNLADLELGSDARRPE